MHTHIGKVEALYQEAHAGVYVPLRMTRERKDMPLWVHVRFDRPLEDGRSFAVAALPEGMSVKVDDTVEMRFGDPSRFDESGPARNIITAVLQQVTHPSADASRDLRAAISRPATFQ